jgi:hypothetical protein
MNGTPTMAASGHPSTSLVTASEPFVTQQPAEKLDFSFEMSRSVTGHDFSRADKANRMNRASAPANLLLPISPDFPSFPAACQTHSVPAPGALSRTNQKTYHRPVQVCRTPEKDGDTAFIGHLSSTPSHDGNAFTVPEMHRNETRKRDKRK